MDATIVAQRPKLKDYIQTMNENIARVLEVEPDQVNVKATTEEKLGFTYEVLDRYIRTGEIEDEAVKAKIDRMHRINLHKLLPMPGFGKED